MFDSILNAVIHGSAWVAIVYVFVYGNKLAADWYARQRGLNSDHAIEEESNLAVGLRRAGLYLGLGIAMEGVISGPSKGFMADTIDIASFGLIVTILFLGARVVNDFFVLGKMENTQEVKKGNIAVGLVEFGSFIATGIIARASMLGVGGGYETAIGFFVLGQILLLLAAVAYEAFSSYKVREEVAKGNAAAGLRLGGLMVALAVGINGAVAYDFVSWTYNLTFLLIDGGIVIAMMIVTSMLADKFFLPGTDIKTEIVRDQNVAAIAVVVAMNVVGSLVISSSLI